MNIKRISEGQLEILFYDTTRFTVSVYREGENVFLCWVNPQGIPYDHLVRSNNKESSQGWIRELSHIFSKEIKTYNFHP